MAPATVADLLQVLARYSLLEPVQLDETKRGLSAVFPDPRALCRELMARGWLTPYQVNQIFQDEAAQLLLAPYVLQDKISESVMGDVFKARHQHMRRVVVLQVIRADLLKTPGAVERFYQEVQAASQLSHPNIVASYDAGPVGQTHFFAMEYVEGIDLERLVHQHGPLPVNQACDLVRQTALGLQHAGERGLRHHDLKPANLLVSEGLVSAHKATDSTTASTLLKIRNLGLTVIRQPTKHSRLGDRAPGATAFSSADYIAPERAASGELGDIRAELYSLGCCLHFLLAGQVPFPGGGVADKHRAHQELQPAAITSLRADVSPEVAGLLRRLMAKRPEDRYQTPAQVAAAVQALPAPAHANTTPAAALSSWGQRRAAEQQRRRHWIRAGTAVLGVGLIVFFGLLFWQSQLPSIGPAVIRPTETDKPVLAKEPALVIQCGRSKAANQTEVLGRGYGYQLLQGDPFDGWGPPVPKTHCWAHGDQVQFQLRVPPATTGLLRLHLVTENNARRERVYVNGRAVGEPIESFAAAGKQVELPLGTSDLRDGRVDVAIKNLAPGTNAVISTVEFVPYVLGGEPPPEDAAIVVQCGKLEEVVARGYGWRQLQGSSFDGWPATAGRTHCWADGDKVRFELTMPKGMSGTLRLFLVDGESPVRKQKLTVAGRDIGEYSKIPLTGQWVEIKITPEDTKEGRVETVIQNLNKDSSAVLSTIEFRPGAK
jgi:serine/threonine-protein kinase